MTPHEFAVTMASIKYEFGDDQEAAHLKMDNLMGEILRGLGYGAGVEIFESQDKWYA